MNTINYSYEEYEEFKKQANEIGSGIESKIYEYNDNTVIKALDKSTYEGRENKKLKLALLSRLDVKNVWPTIRGLIFVDDKFKAYLMEYFPNYVNLSKYIFLSSNEKIEVLSKLKEELLEMHNNDIVYVDINLNNMIVKKENDSFLCRFVDIDNVQIGELEHDVCHSMIDIYIKSGGVIGINSDIFMFNLITYFILNSTITANGNLMPNLFSSFIQDRKVIDFGRDLRRGNVNSLADNEFLIDHMKQYTLK